MRSGSPFYHFRSKQELLKAAMIEGLDAGHAQLLSAIDGIADPEANLRVIGAHPPRHPARRRLPLAAAGE